VAVLFCFNRYNKDDYYQISRNMNHIEELPIITTETLSQKETERIPLRKDIEAIKEAQQFFQSFGVIIEEDGFLSTDLSEEQSIELKSWRDKTVKNGDIQLPTEEVFFKKVLLAVSLWRQKEGKRISYLMGKGTGIEIALKGEIKGRKKRPVEFPYRSHSDFELYGVSYQEGADGKGNIGEEPFSENFRKIIGGQEYFPFSRTKGLKSLPPNLLQKTAEVVDFGGVPIYVPQLELLFLDKYIAQESTPRPEGIDAELLARQYVLDRERIHRYLEQYYIEPKKTEIRHISEAAFQTQLEGIKNNILRRTKEAKDSGDDFDIRDILDKFNEDLRIRIEISGAEVYRTFDGVRMDLWEEIALSQIDSDGNITDKEYLKRLSKKIEQKEKARIESLQKKHIELDQMFDKIEKELN